MVGHADLPTGSRRPVGAVFWAIVSASTVSVVAIVPLVVARAIVVVVLATQIPIVAAVVGAAAIVWAAAVVLAIVLPRRCGARSLLVAGAVDEVAGCGLLGCGHGFVGELPCSLLQRLLRE